MEKPSRFSIFSYFTIEPFVFYSFFVRAHKKEAEKSNITQCFIHFAFSAGLHHLTSGTQKAFLRPKSKTTPAGVWPAGVV